MSHQIRTPMNPILGFAEILRAELDGQETEHHDYVTVDAMFQLEIGPGDLETASLDQLVPVIGQERVEHAGHHV